MSSAEFDAAEALAKASRAEMNWLRQRGREGRRWTLVAIAAPLVGGCLVIAQAFCLATILRRSIVDGLPSRENLEAVALLVGIFVARAIVAWIGERAGANASEAIKFAIRRDLFAALMARQPDWMRGRSSGELTSQIVDQVEALDGYFARFLPAMVAASLLPAAFAIGLMPVDIVVGLIFLVTAPLIPLFMALVGWGAEAASRRHMTAMSRLSGLFADRLRGLVVLKLFGRAEDEVDRVRKASDELAERTLSVLRIAFLSSAVLEFFAALGVAGVALYVGLTYLGLVDLRGVELGLGAGLFCLLMAPEVYMPLRTLAAHYHDRAAAKAAVAGLAASFEVLPRLEPGAGMAPLPVVASPSPRSLSIRALSVSAEGRGTILDAIDLEIAPGERIAILGPSGTGKSTLVEAIARLRPFEGIIDLDGKALAAWDETELRQSMALLGQRPRLFHGTIASNIRLARPGASEEAVQRAAALAHVSDFADRLPEGLEAILGERGVGISGGEAQRVALARIFLRDPGLVLLDEPTAHLDADTEARMIESILAFCASRTLVVATHSPALARRMDRIYRIAGGRLLQVPHRPTGASFARTGRGEGN